MQQQEVPEQECKPAQESGRPFHRLRRRGVRAVIAALVLLAFGTGVAIGQFWPAASVVASQAAPSHEQMHALMDAMHGPGTSQRMHEAMGPDAERLMDQCVAAMPDMRGMTSMTGSGMDRMMQSMMGGRGQ